MLSAGETFQELFEGEKVDHVGNTNGGQPERHVLPRWQHNCPTIRNHCFSNRRRWQCFVGLPRFICIVRLFPLGDSTPLPGGRRPRGPERRSRAVRRPLSRRPCRRRSSFLGPYVFFFGDARHQLSHVRRKLLG